MHAGPDRADAEEARRRSRRKGVRGGLQNRGVGKKLVVSRVHGTGVSFAGGAARVHDDIHQQTGSLLKYK